MNGWKYELISISSCEECRHRRDNDTGIYRCYNDDSREKVAETKDGKIINLYTNDFPDWCTLASDPYLAI